ncbi:hypothetical protein MTO96_014832 [Rhipicephalus appendiculatus]
MLVSTPSVELAPSQLAEITRQDPVLSRVKAAVGSGELRKLANEEFAAYRKIGAELSIQEGCLLRGCRVVIPEKARKSVLGLAHENHRGIVAMKACARSYFWWPGVDRDIEEVARNCVTCRQHQKAPGKAPMPQWERATTPWHTIHADFAGPVEGRMLLVVVDAYTKWLEVRCMRNIQTATVIEEMRNLFATFGLPKKLVTDNGPSFVSSDFEEFLKKNGAETRMASEPGEQRETTRQDTVPAPYMLDPPADSTVSSGFSLTEEPAPHEPVTQPDTTTASRPQRHRQPPDRYGDSI